MENVFSITPVINGKPEELTVIPFFGKYRVFKGGQMLALLEPDNEDYSWKLREGRLDEGSLRNIGMQIDIFLLKN